MLITNLKKKMSLYLKEHVNMFNETENESKIIEYVNVLETLLNNYNSRFSDFKKIEAVIELHNNPLTCIIENLNDNIKEEVAKMRSDIALPLSNGVEFWKSVNQNEYPYTKNEI